MATVGLDVRTFDGGVSQQNDGPPVMGGGRPLIPGSTSETDAPAIDSDPPLALDKFIQQSGLSAVTVWRYRRAGMLRTLNICGRIYLTRAEIRRFNERAAKGEFAKALVRPARRKNQK